MRFSLRIELGNDAMQSGSDLARALRAIAARVELLNEVGVTAPIRRAINDDNGNTVGQWEITGS